MAKLIYKDPSQGVAARTKDLLSRLSVEEKVGQMLQLDARRNAASLVKEFQPGSMLSILGEDIVAPQKAALATRLGIPILFGIDAIHGHSMHCGATIFPSQLALSCSWNLELCQQTASATAAEVDCTGVHWTFSPVFCLPRDLRWGRVDETSGEDPYLISLMGCALVRGYQGKNLAQRGSIAACAKHFAGYGETVGGRDASEADHSLRKMRSLFLPPFEAAVKAGAATFMVGYEAIDGLPCSVNRWLLTDVLRNEWNFDGVVVTDWDNCGRLVKQKFVSPDLRDASIRCVNAGNDLMMATPGFYKAALEGIKEGHIPIAEVDQAVQRVLELKFKLGLFEDPRLPDARRAKTVIGCPEHRRLCLDSARQSLVLLKNRADLLPIRPARLRRIAVIGPNADNAPEQLGDWSLGPQQGQGIMAAHPRDCTTSVLDGLRHRLDNKIEVAYAEGCQITSSSQQHIAKAVRLAESADLSVLVLGDNLAYVGECKSTATLELMGAQLALLNAVAATGTPLVVVLINSKPLVLTAVAEQADAIIEAFNPGMEGGTAIAELICGDIAPVGRLTISFPYHVGQLPVFYNQLPGAHQDQYPDLGRGCGEALFAFGEGLTGTKFKYQPVRLAKDRLKAGQSLRAEVVLGNVGEREGTEVTQVYLRDLFTSATWPVKNLVDFQRTTLPSGARRTLEFEIPSERLSLINAQGQRVVEPGEFELMIGASSRDRDLQRVRFWVD